MGGGVSVPQLPQIQENPNWKYGIDYNIEGGPDLLGKLQGRMNQGLDPAVMNQWRASGQGAIGSNYKSIMDSINNTNPTATLSGKAGMIDKFTKSRGQELAGLETNISQADQGAKMQNFWNSARMIPELSQTAYGIGAGKYGQYMQGQGMNANNLMAQYQMEKQNEFDWGGLLGELLGTAGSLGSGWLMGKAMKPN